MLTVELRDAKFRAGHGIHAAERTLEGNFLLHVSAQLDSIPVNDSYTLENTLDYSKLYELCAQVMQRPVPLIETVATAIIDEIEANFQHLPLRRIEVEIQKLNPPIPGRVGAAVVRVAREMT